MYRQGEVALNWFLASCLVASLQNGGIDDYIMNTKADLLGWEGMRIRVRLRDHIKEQQRKLAQGLPVTTSSVPRWSKASPPVQGTFATSSS